MPYAFDRSVRTTDANGILHIAVSNISKATVNPYRGAEIPDYEALGLDPDAIYQLLRDPDELAKAAPTFNNLPVLCRHVPFEVTEDSDMTAQLKDLTCGSTGTDATFNDPYLQNSASIWAADAISGVESKEQCEWSCAYRYVADMTPGTYKGLRFDGVMRNIVGNHVALVTEGRAGPDVVVGDSQLKGQPMRLTTRTALMLSGALSLHLRPILAADAKPDLSPALATVTKTSDPAKVGAAVAKALKGVKLAKDGDLDIAGVVDVIKAVQGVDTPADEPDIIPEVMEETPAVDADGDMLAKIMAFLKGKISDEDMAELTAMSGGSDEPAAEDGDAEELDVPPGKKDDKMPPAMDRRTVTKIAHDAATAAMANLQAIRVAERAVAPHIGVVPEDLTSPAAIYRLALDSAGVDYKGVHESALAAMVGMLPAPGEGHIAFDHKSPSDHAATIPGFDRLTKRRA